MAWTTQGRWWDFIFYVPDLINKKGQKVIAVCLTMHRGSQSSRGHNDGDTVDAVIRAIVLSLQLRSYLEGKSDLSWPTLRRILFSHNQERSATELYKQLTTEVQCNKDTPQNFLIRAMDLRQKILFASQEAESSLKYDPMLVQSMFR